MQKYKFVDEKLRLIDKRGRLVDSENRLIDDNGRFINEEGNFVDKNGNLVDQEGDYIVDAEPFLDEEGKPVVLEEVKPEETKLNDTTTETKTVTEPEAKDNTAESSASEYNF